MVDFLRASASVELSPSRSGSQVNPLESLSGLREEALGAARSLRRELPEPRRGPTQIAACH